MNNAVYPIKLTAPIKDYIWGGTKLISEYNKKTDLPCAAESWELSCHKDGSSVIQNGVYAGKTLTEFISARGKSILGSSCAGFDSFPVLIKLIDACDNLSVQVHPDNDYAKRVEGEYGKTEMWYIVDCEEGASLIYGFKDTISKAEFASRIADNTLLEVTNTVPVKKGDVFFIQAGTLHAIGKGILIAEIQQNSNTTYRVYDYGRVGADGKPRDLHIEKALDVTTLGPPTRKPCAAGAPIKTPGCVKTLLSSCEYFTSSLLTVDAWPMPISLVANNASFHSLLCLDGKFNLDSKHGDITFEKGDSIFLQAGFGEYRLRGRGEIIQTVL